MWRWNVEPQSHSLNFFAFSYIFAIKLTKYLLLYRSYLCDEDKQGAG